MSFPAGESWKSLTTSPTASASCDFPISFRDPQLAQDISNQKTNRGPSREGPLSRARLRPQIFCEFY
jgi:hypothetical protein